jgi:7,8-dihydropterin-6-yl-methyl-4-(beta-D-ribofuranosyl)aminobenzene 5'-phosphate synthase
MEIAKNLGSVEKICLTVLVDNKADLIVESSEQIKYFTDKPLLAEHGFSVLIQPENSEEKILWDAGVSKVALIENMRRMQLDIKSISKIALSHGHLDHYAAMTELLHEIDLVPEEKEWSESVNAEEIEHWIEASRIPIVSHPAAFRERWWVKDDGTLVGPFLPPPAGEWKAAGAKLIHSELPYELSPGCWTTGFIPRTSFEQSGRSEKLLYRKGPDFIPDDLEEDQAIVINVNGKGLIVLSGCAHSGIVNTVTYAQEFSGINTIYGIIGGFHLASADDEEIDRTVEYIKSIKPQFLIPSHCTGLRAISRFAQEMPEEFVEGIVGATYYL